MAIHIIYGPGGAGKSRFQVGDVVIPELVYGRRNVLTNLPLNTGRLNQFLEERFPAVKVDVVGRLRILTSEECAVFWRHRGPFHWKTFEGGFGGHPTIELVEYHNPYGTVYVIDEAGDVGFSAVAWAENIGRTSRAVECVHYLDQQRKMGDDSYFSTNGRAPNAIAKGFRDKAHFFIRLKNNRLAVFGMFRGSDNLQWQKFTVEPTPSNGAEPVASGKFDLDIKGVASCYRTQDGNGIVGTVADIGKRPKGISIYWVFPMFIALSSLCVLIPWLLGKGTAAVMSTHAADVSKAVDASARKADPVSPAVTVHQGEPKKTVAASEVYATGWARVGSRVRVTLSDGTTLNDDEIRAVSRSAVYLADGRRFPFRAQRTPVSVETPANRQKPIREGKYVP